MPEMALVQEIFNLKHGIWNMALHSCLFQFDSVSFKYILESSVLFLTQSRTRSLP